MNILNDYEKINNTLKNKLQFYFNRSRKSKDYIYIDLIMNLQTYFLKADFREIKKLFK